MKERPILFSAPMVRALLSGTKTQTRRVMKLVQVRPDGMSDAQLAAALRLCPYGVPGDRLWVREAHGYVSEDKFGPVWDSIIYRADDNAGWSGKWRPSIHMPRAASRITLEVTGVRVERLQEISEADAIAEGIEPGAVPGWWSLYGRDANDDMDRSPRVAYRSLWESINGPGSWDSNPFVWVVEFKRLETA